MERVRKCVIEIPVGADVTAARTVADLVGLFSTEMSETGEIMTRYDPPRDGVLRITIELVPEEVLANTIRLADELEAARIKRMKPVKWPWKK